ncbi:MAG: tRNA(Met) cytidine acetyltransferase TmcA domain-containing protein, partial [Halodesulfurarchaeum sp.]
MLESVAAALRTEAEWTNERRLLVLSGGGTDRFDAVARALSSAGIESNQTTLVGHENGLSCEHRKPDRADALLGTTREAVVVDCHEECRPNVLGRVVGSVNGGGLLVLLTPALETWPSHRDAFDATLAVPPADVESVTGRFRRRLIRTLRVHPGIAIVDLDAPAVLDDGLTHPAPRLPPEPISLPDQTSFPTVAYEACLTQDQVTALLAFESLRAAPASVVVSADRGRGKSSAAGLAAASFAMEGEDVLVTAPSVTNAAEVFARAEALLDRMESRADDPEGAGHGGADRGGARRLD